MKTERLLTVALCLLCCLQLVIVLLSWILNTLMPESGVRSMLQGEAIRWFCGHFVDFCASPCLVWIILLAMASGTCHASGITDRHTSCHGDLRRHRHAMMAVLAVVVVYACIVSMLTLVPHAVLLSAVGRLFPSPFSAAIMVFVSLLIFIVSVVYGIVTGRFSSVRDIACSLSYGVSIASPLLVLYIFTAAVTNSVIYVFSI